jgi:Flp pilus assembly protein TadD
MAYGPPMSLRPIPLLAALLLAATPVLAAHAPAPAAKASKPTPPVTVESLLAQAHAAIGKGDTQLAVRLAQSAIVADPARPTSYVALGDIYAESGQAEYARSYYDEALGIDPAEPSALKAIADLDRSHPQHTASANP